MTVSDLIAELNKVEDKEKEVFMSIDPSCYLEEKGILTISIDGVTAKYFSDDDRIEIY